MSASAVRSGRAYIELFTKDSAMIKGLDRAQRRLNSFGKNVAKIGALVTGFGLSVLAPIVMAISAASDMEETMNKFNVVFGANSAAVKQWGDDYGKAVGRSKQQIADFMASNQDLLVPMGFEEGAATEMSKQITELSVDLASFNNKADADVLNDLQAALTGSGEVMKKYGVIVNQAAVNQELLNSGLDPRVATEAQKAQARFAIILRGTTAAQGDAIRSAGSWANQKKRLSANIKDAAASLGSKLLPLLTPYLKRVADFVGMTAEWIEKNESAVRSAVKIAAIIVAVGFAFTAAGVAIMGLGAVAGGLSAMLTLVGSGISLLIGLLLFLVSPIGLLIAGIAGLTYAFFTMTETGSRILASLSEQWSALQGTATSAIGGIVTALKSGQLEAAGKIAMLGLKAVWLQVTAELSNIWTRLTGSIANASINAWAMIRTGFVQLTNFLSVVWSTFTAGFQKRLAGAQNGIAKQVLHVMAFFDDSIDVDDAQATLEEDYQRRKTAIDQQRNDAINQADVTASQSMSDINAEAEQTIAESNALTQEKLAANNADVAAARAELDAAVAAANQVAAETQANEEKIYRPDGPLGGAIAGTAAGVEVAQRAAANTALNARSGSGISAIIAATSGGRNVEDQMLSELRDQNSFLNELVQESRRGNRAPRVELVSENA